MTSSVLSVAIENGVNTSILTFNQPILHKLDQHNYGIWKSQIIPALRGLNLDGYVDGSLHFPPEVITTTMVVPTPTAPVSTENTAPNESASTGTSRIIVEQNPKYTLWIRQDQLLLSWLILSLIEPILAKVVNCTTSDQLITEAELVSHILFGLPSNYESIANFVYVRGSPITYDDLSTLLLTHESLLAQKKD
ncbi:hypothetical protein LIER_18975 [Lithospermum erythrorhizon]|uniref:Retrotransposon Copia-like N-terminal domain-containing protein n=1 Tax=Lithospermum erythrorhizon TaxID=34254 RepID=A0AAV3QG03_LITER